MQAVCAARQVTASKKRAARPEGTGVNPPVSWKNVRADRQRAREGCQACLCLPRSLLLAASEQGGGVHRVATCSLTGGGTAAPQA